MVKVISLKWIIVLCDICLYSRYLLWSQPLCATVETVQIVWNPCLIIRCLAQLNVWQVNKVSPFEMERLLKIVLFSAFYFGFLQTKLCTFVPNVLNWVSVINFNLVMLMMIQLEPWKWRPLPKCLLAACCFAESISSWLAIVLCVFIHYMAKSWRHLTITPIRGSSPNDCHKVGSTECIGCLYML